MTKETLFWRSAIVKYAVVSAINLAILLVGIAIGVLLAPHIEKGASAAQQSSSQQGQTVTPPEQEYEDITPQLGANSMAASTFLAHRIATDQLMVNGYDVMALHDGVLNVLKNKGIISFRDLDAVVERAKVFRPLRVKPPQPPQSVKPEEKKP